MAYVPISCVIHDRLEALAVLGRTIRLIHRTSDAATHRARSRILDIYASDGAEYLLLENGQRIRLDRIVEFSGPGSAPVIVDSP